MKPYQRNIIKLITDGKTKRLKIVPYRTIPSLKHKHLIDFIMDETIQAQVKTHSADISMMQVKVYRPNLIIIDDIEAPHRNKAIDMFSNIGYALA